MTLQRDIPANLKLLGLEVPVLIGHYQGGIPLQPALQSQPIAADCRVPFD